MSRFEQSPVAIIGIGCRFPGASGPEAFWRLLCEGRDVITEVPPSRFDINEHYDPRPRTPGKLITRWGGFIEDPDRFDAAFFGISPREAARMDPQQRLLLEVAWEALEDAAQPPDALVGTRTAVYVGCNNGDYEHLQVRNPQAFDMYACAGSSRHAIAGRVSHQFGLNGPTMTVDTGCSSSLVAVHLACQGLRSGEVPLALACASNLILMPEFSIPYSGSEVLSPDGRCKTFDARANGFVRSDGIAVLVLKPLARALAERDRIYAVVRGTAVNHDGQGPYMQPSRRGQETLLRTACEAAGVAPGELQYLEAHGTGTSVGDPIEVQAIGAVLGQGRPRDLPLIIGSVKTNIGHTEGTAGLAGMIKTALALYNRQLPPNLHFKTPNPAIPWAELPVRVRTELGPWPEHEGPALAGVNSFGISGVNGHVILQEPPPPEPVPVEVRSERRAHLLTLSAQSPVALGALARAHQERLAAQPVDLEDLCHTASVRRAHLDHRLAVVARDREELLEHLGAFLAREARPGLSAGAHVGAGPKVAFVFSGQGSQWLGMGRQLLEQEPVFRQSLERWSEAMREHAGWSLLERLTSPHAERWLQEIAFIQPALIAVQVALAELWRSWGIVPAAVVGHSMGEVAAWHMAGALSLEDAARIICLRSRLLARTAGQGIMVAVDLSVDQAEQAIQGFEDKVAVAVSNGPSSSVLSGEPQAVQAVVEEIKKKQIFCRPVKVDVASHSPQMEPLRDELLAGLAGLRPQPASLPVFSTARRAFGRRSEDGAQVDARYWWDNMRNPVLFSNAALDLIDGGYRVFLEASPHPILAVPLTQCLAHREQSGTVLPSLRREEDERAVMLGSLGALYALGKQVRWEQIYPVRRGFASLPAYPWQRERYWYDDPGAGGASRPQRKRMAPGRLLGTRVTPATEPATYLWDGVIDIGAWPFLAEHQVQGVAVLPAAAYAEMALAAAAEAFGPGTHAVEELRIRKALFFPEGGAQAVQLVLSPEAPGTASLRFFGRPAGDPKQPWALLVTGRLRSHSAAEPSPDGCSIQELQAACAPVTAAEHYQWVERRGIHYGPVFQGVEQLWRRDGEALARLRLATSEEAAAAAFVIHPALLDAGFQALLATFPEEIPPDDLYIPVELGLVRLYGRPRSALYSHAVLRPAPAGDGDRQVVDVRLLDDDGTVVLEALGLAVQRVDGASRQSPEQRVESWLHEIRWEPRVLEPRRAPPIEGSPGRWLIFCDPGRIADQLAAELSRAGVRSLLVRQARRAIDAYEQISDDEVRLRGDVPEDIQRMLQDYFGPGQPCLGVVHMRGLDSEAPGQVTLASLEAAQQHGCVSAMHLVQALATIGWPQAPRLWLLTRGTQAVSSEDKCEAIAHSTLWGLGRAVSLEHPELHCSLIDLSATPTPEELPPLADELLAGDPEQQVALRGSTRFVARLARVELEARAPSAGPVWVEGQSFALGLSVPGVLDSVALQATSRRTPGPGQVEVEVVAAGINFRDVMLSLGLIPPVGEELRLGLECAGRICAVGSGVTGLAVGDEVIAVGDGCFTSHLVTDARLVWPKPREMSFEEAAGIPMAFATAWYALVHQGRLARGERILIHAATGGVGLAAVQLAQRVGAEIFATAGSPEKRDYLRTLGITHVMDSRTLDFADEVSRLTGGEGVDVVLNSLAGEALSRSISTLRPYGRFLELGKRDFHQNSLLGLRPFARNLSFFGIDLDRLFRERPVFYASMMEEILRCLGEGSLRLPPVRTFPMSEAAQALRHMAQAKHIGKLVLSVGKEQVAVRPSYFRPGRSYLISGGLGGIGLSVARWMVKQGARHLVLLGRSAPSLAAERVIAEMERAGACVRVVRADVAREADVARVLADLASGPPLAGIFHSAGVLNDGILLQMNEERFLSVMGPKVSGAWNLVNLTRALSMEFIVFFSSAASIVGSPGQGNYAAANAFLDALAHQLRAAGRPAMSINWGPWSEVGLAARPDRGGRLAQRGLGSISPRQGVAALEHILGQGVAQLAVMPFDPERWFQAYPMASESPFLSGLVAGALPDTLADEAPPDGDEVTRAAIIAASPSSREGMVESHIRAVMARVLGLPVAKLDVSQPPIKLGVDSLMAVEIKNRVERDLGAIIPVVKLLEAGSVSQLVALALDQIVAEAPPAEAS